MTGAISRPIRTHSYQIVMIVCNRGFTIAPRLSPNPLTKPRPDPSTRIMSLNHTHLQHIIFHIRHDLTVDNWQHLMNFFVDSAVITRTLTFGLVAFVRYRKSSFFIFPLMWNESNIQVGYLKGFSSTTIW